MACGTADPGVRLRVAMEQSGGQHALHASGSPQVHYPREQQGARSDEAQGLPGIVEQGTHQERHAGQEEEKAGFPITLHASTL